MLLDQLRTTPVGLLNWRQFCYGIFMSVYYIISYSMELSKYFDSDGGVTSISPEIEADDSLNISILG